jgi:hypothetical protein
MVGDYGWVAENIENRDFSASNKEFFRQAQEERKETGICLKRPPFTQMVLFE